ncbi:MAG TPA: hypothetical protein VFJ07_05340 [Streptosporangiaceae bacterium]|nr:hypothetical protein [Streptosporangiaceae bacterium]
MGSEKSIIERTAGWPGRASGSRRSAVMSVTFGAPASSGSDWAAAIGSRPA